MELGIFGQQRREALAGSDPNPCHPEYRRTNTWRDAATERQAADAAFARWLVERGKLNEGVQP